MEEYHCIRRGQHTILISPYVGELFGARLSGQRYLIPNPVDPAFFEVPRRELPGTVLFAGRLNARKGVLDLVDAISRLKDIPESRLVLAGSTSDSQYVAGLRSRIASLSLTSRVDFRGSLEPAAFMQALSECSCLVLPAYQETAPMVIQEAMACGVPVISTDICGMPYQVAHGKTGYLFPPGNIDTLADKLRMLLTQATLRQEFGAAAKEKAEKEYRSSSVAALTRDVYLRMLSG
jgi:glycosyltransferase involved in cell wall biosynthesis